MFLNVPLAWPVGWAELARPTVPTGDSGPQSLASAIGGNAGACAENVGTMRVGASRETPGPNLGTLQYPAVGRPGPPSQTPQVERSGVPQRNGRPFPGRRTTTPRPALQSCHTFALGPDNTHRRAYRGKCPSPGPPYIRPSGQRIRGGDPGNPARVRPGEMGGPVAPSRRRAHSDPTRQSLGCSDRDEKSWGSAIPCDALQEPLRNRLLGS